MSNAHAHTHTHIIVQWIRKNRWTVKKTFLHLFPHTFTHSLTCRIHSFQSSAIAVFAHCYLYGWNMWSENEEPCEKKDSILIELWVDLNEQSCSLVHTILLGDESENFIELCVCVCIGCVCFRRFEDERILGVEALYYSIQSTKFWHFSALFPNSVRISSFDGYIFFLQHFNHLANGPKSKRITLTLTSLSFIFICELIIYWVEYN